MTGSISVVAWDGVRGQAGRSNDKGGYEETLGSNVYIHDLDYGDGCTGGCICQNVSNCII